MFSLSVFTSPFQFHIHPYAPKREKKKNYWQRMRSRKNELPNRIQTHCPSEHRFGTLHYPVELTINFEGPSLDFQLPYGHSKGTVRVKY